MELQPERTHPFFIISADDHSLFAVFQPGNEFMCEQMHFAESHTAAHDEKQRSILGKTEMAAHILFGCRARKCGPHRNTERKQFFFRDAAGCKLRDQILVRNHIVIAVRLFPERNARVIGGNGNAGNRQPSFLFHPGQCFCRIKMCGDNGIKMVLNNIICKRISKPRICIVNGGFPGKFPYQLTKLIECAEAGRKNGDELHISSADQCGGMLSTEAHQIQNLGFVVIKIQTFF